MKNQHEKSSRRCENRSIVRCILFVAILVAFVGCSPNVSVKGKVVFEDGRPLQIGSVVFQSGSHVGKGKITSGGDFTIGSLKPGDGLPPGHYKVYVIDAGEVPPDFVPEPGSDDSGIVSLIDPQYGAPETTPIQFDVVKKSFFEIKVEPYVPPK